MYSYLWNFRVKYSENFESEIRTKFTENFEIVLGKLWGSFEKYKKISWKIKKIFGNFEQIFEKFVGLIFLQFEKFSVIQVLTYYDLKEIKKKICKANWKSFTESSRKIWENFN